jgi:hypothetical protein
VSAIGTEQHPIGFLFTTPSKEARADGNEAEWFEQVTEADYQLTPGDRGPP